LTDSFPCQGSYKCVDTCISRAPFPIFVLICVAQILHARDIPVSYMYQIIRNLAAGFKYRPISIHTAISYWAFRYPIRFNPIILADIWFGFVDRPILPILTADIDDIYIKNH